MLLDLITEFEHTGAAIPCRSYDPELFFAERPEDVERAKALCTGCPVRLACMAGASSGASRGGSGAAKLFVQGVVVARKRPRGRPRKDAVAA